MVSSVCGSEHLGQAIHRYPTQSPPPHPGGGGGVVKFCWVDRYIYPTSTGNQINPPPPRPYPIPNRRYVVSVGVKPDNSLFFFFFPFSIKYGRGIVRLNIHRDHIRWQQKHTHQNEKSIRLDSCKRTRAIR